MPALGSSRKYKGSFASLLACCTRSAVGTPDLGDFPGLHLFTPKSSPGHSELQKLFKGSGIKQGTSITLLLPC